MLILSELMSKRLPPAPEPVPIGLIVWGINTGNIRGDEADLKDFTLSNLTDPKEIERPGVDGPKYGSVMSDLLIGYSDCTSEVKKNIICTFRVLFEKNPMSIISSYLVEDRFGQKIWTTSAIERIADFTLLDTFLPELLAFISQNVAMCSETQLRTFVSGIHGHATLTKELMRVFSPENIDLSRFERNHMHADELKSAIGKHWHSDHRGDFDFFYGDFPTLEVWRLLMDGSQQQQGWGHYEAREKGCINQLYQAFHFVKDTTSRPLTPEYFKSIHKICSETIIWQWETKSGVYRSNRTQFGVSRNSMSFLGYLDHIKQFQTIGSLKKHSGLSFDVMSLIETDNLDETITDYIREYEIEVAADVENPAAILRALILLCKKLVIIHPFSDCNGRLFCNLILNRELVRHGFSPTLLDDPNRIDGYTLNESLYELIKGMNSFQELKDTGRLKDAMTTNELIKSGTYPIQEISELLEQSKSQAAARGQFGLFRPPQVEGHQQVAEKKADGDAHVKGST